MAYDYTNTITKTWTNPRKNVLSKRYTIIPYKDGSPVIADKLIYLDSPDEIENEYHRLIQSGNYDQVEMLEIPVTEYEIEEESTYFPTSNDAFKHITPASTVPFSFTTWVRLPLADLAPRTIYARGKNGVGIQYAVQTDNLGRAFRIAIPHPPDPDTESVATDDLDLNVWYHVGFTVNSTGTSFKLYLNGVLIDTLTDTLETMAATEHWLATKPDLSDGLQGDLSMFRTWTTELRQDEIQAEMNDREQTQVRTINSWSDWLLGDQQPEDIPSGVDQSGNGHDLTVVGTPEIATGAGGF